MHTGTACWKSQKSSKKENIPFLCVDSFFEALILRNENIRTPILIIGYTHLETIKKNKLPHIAFTVISITELKRLAASKIQATIHLKFDTGMHRHGILPGELEEALAIAQSNPQLNIEGVSFRTWPTRIRKILLT